MLTFIANLILALSITSNMYQECFAPPSECDLPPECAALPPSTFNGLLAKEVQKQADERKLGISVIRLACFPTDEGISCYVFATSDKTKSEDITSAAASMACEYNPACPKEAEENRQEGEKCLGIFACPDLSDGEEDWKDRLEEDWDNTCPCDEEPTTGIINT